MSLSIPAGRMRFFATIERSTETRTDTGAAVPAWSVVATNVPCDLEPVNGREFFGATQIQAEVDTKITLRFFPGLDSKMRLTANGVIYDIRAILPDRTQRSHMVLMCKSGINRG